MRFSVSLKQGSSWYCTPLLMPPTLFTLLPPPLFLWSPPQCCTTLAKAPPLPSLHPPFPSPPGPFATLPAALLPPHCCTTPAGRAPQPLPCYLAIPTPVVLPHNLCRTTPPAQPPAAHLLHHQCNPPPPPPRTHVLIPGAVCWAWPWLSTVTLLVRNC